MSSSQVVSNHDGYVIIRNPLRQVPIERVVQRVTEISTLPQVAIKILEIGRDPQAGAADICTVVEGDPALSSRILRLVNSAAYSLRTRINSLQRAIGYVGFHAIRNLAVTALVSDIFQKDSTVGCYRRCGLWRHMVSVAVCARMIAMRRRLANFEEVFLAGLLHDLGIILEDQYCHTHFVHIIEHLKPETPLVQIEQEVLGFDHTTLGARVAEGWNFPEEALSAIRFHHITPNYRGSHSQILACVELANLLCSMAGRTSVGQMLLQPTVYCTNVLELTRDDVRILADDLDQELRQNKHLFDLGKT